MAAIEEPLIQVIDVPRYPLESSGGGMLKFVFIGGVLGGLLVIGCLVLLESLKGIEMS
jgi:uncharacterized protein involved in exopolysaccharide biosynthesis